MRNLLIALFCVLFAVSAFAQDAAPAAEPAAAPAAVAAAPAEGYNGVLEVTPADAAAGKTESTIVLDMGEKSYKLEVVDAAKRAELEALAGKTITVKGEVVAATAQELDVIKVASWEVSAATTEEAAPDAE